MKSWLLRPNPHGIDRMEEFIEYGIVAVGWPGIGDLSNKSRDDIKTILSGPPYNYTGGKLGNAYGTVDYFVNQMSVGDLVFVPYEKDVHIGRITSEYIYDQTKDNNTDGYPHQRSVEWIKEILRNDLPKELRASMRTQITIANLSHHNQIIQAIVAGQPLNSDEDYDINEKIDKLMVEALQIIQDEMQSNDPDRKLKAAIELIRIKKSGFLG